MWGGLTLDWWAICCKALGMSFASALFLSLSLHLWSLFNHHILNYRLTNSPNKSPMDGSQRTYFNPFYTTKHIILHHDHIQQNKRWILYDLHRIQKQVVKCHSLLSIHCIWMQKNCFELAEIYYYYYSTCYNYSLLL